jgi:hypothetical protein
MCKVFGCWKAHKTNAGVSATLNLTVSKKQTNIKTMKIKKRTNRAVQCLTVLGMAGWCLPAIAQDSDQVDTEEPVTVGEMTKEHPNLTVFAGGSRQFNSHIDGGGNFSIDRFRTGVGLPIKINDQYTVTTKFNYELDSYDFGGGVVGWHNINLLTGVSLLQYRYNQQWLWYGGPILRIAAEGSDFSNATDLGGAFGVNYIASDKLSYGGGIVVIGQIEENALVAPIITVNWKFAEQWALKLGMTDLATAGYGITVAYDLNPEWELSFAGQYHKSRFRIEALNNGIGQEKAFTMTVNATWKPEKVKAFSATAFAGIAAGGEVAVYTANATQLRKDKYDAAPIVGAKAVFTF